MDKEKRSKTRSIFALIIAILALFISVRSCYIAKYHTHIVDDSVNSLVNSYTELMQELLDFARNSFDELR